jgi:acetoin utilization deacetylase AcuC-like enzyme
MNHDPDELSVFFHARQLDHRPLYEWAFGDKLDHPETTTRAENILAALAREPTIFGVRAPERIPPSLLRAIHDPRLVDLYRAATHIEEGRTYYPSVFPKRRETEPDPSDIKQAGYFCFDSGTPLTNVTWEAAAWSAACAVAAAREIRSGSRLSYALCRPPGHHASRDLFGGYCYFNNAALAAEQLPGRVAIVDIDFHHGNGTQELYWRDGRVLFVSIHGDPREFYPYFSGFASERGQGEGDGKTINLPLPRGCDLQEYLRVLDDDVLPELEAFAPEAIVLSAGLDTYRRDPIGAFTLDTPDFHAIGERLGALGKPIVVVQEGGYCTDALGDNAVSLLLGLREGLGRR